jgi:hypothetical protein
MGGYSSAEWMPEITFLNTATAGFQNAGEPARKLMPMIGTKVLVVIESGFPLSSAMEIFKSIPRSETLVISLDERCSFLESFLGKPLTGRSGGQHVPSTGFFACLALLACGARRVKLAGLSFVDGHSYPYPVSKREHIERDCEVLKWLLASDLPVEFDPEFIASARMLLAE